ncbi:MAG TPA: Stp1/IreP family PP2C-type Ser/Thr phosphatase [Candidatus Aveggerthella stercoripullorum]|mgnify:CR=1 FL=1|uniref:Stp1/IreP family PP2C-type Ser/Thr phosphatase n=1 Tax=Candidatus Aveggerthella stercoripullorum TaxID=2840688 RepID=A0A9D1D4T9_9ACTN|nr:Stp1/IreP family PP2C-type Ser/Thr phosphatase [Candidatus Aveggerthella stercoripullorum]
MASDRVQRIKSRRPNGTFGSRTDVGCVRDHNEDSLLVAPPLFAVADGMGGHAAGEVASEIAITVLGEKAPHTPDAAALGRAVEDANRAVILAANEKRGRAGMGTTITAAVLQKDRLVIAQVGDSRAYLLHQGRLQQLTRDHSLMADMIEAGRLTPEEARTHPNRSVITRALGSDPRMVPDLYEITVETGDRLLLCSDGLSSMVEDSAIESTLARTRDPQRCASMLVNEAIAAGGYDNVTVVVVDVAGQIDKVTRRYKRRSRLFMSFVILLLLAILGAAGFGVYAYIDASAYLIAENGTVSIYRGVPDELFGQPLSRLDHATDISVDDLQPGVASRLQTGIRVDGLEAANRLVDEYRAYIEQSAASETPEANRDDAGTANSSSSAATSSSEEQNDRAGGDVS